VKKQFKEYLQETNKKAKESWKQLGIQSEPPKTLKAAKAKQQKIEHEHGKIKQPQKIKEQQIQEVQPEPQQQAIDTKQHFYGDAFKLFEQFENDFGHIEKQMKKMRKSMFKEFKALEKKMI